MSRRINLNERPRYYRISAEIPHFRDRTHPSSSASLPMPDTGLNSEKIDGLELIIPPDFFCPLSLSIMTDPVYILGDETE